MEVGKAFRDMLAVEGIDLGPPKAIFYNDSEGRLHVRSALQELEIVERLLQMLSAQPAKIHIAVKFIEVPETVIDKVGNRLFRAVPRRGASSAILARNQFTELIRLLRADSGTELLSNSGVTTLSGRQAQVQALDMRTILTGIKSEALTFPSVSSTNGAGVSDVFERKSTPFGTVLDVVPYVEADGVTFSMFINLTVTKFLGYEGSASKADVRVYVNGQEERASMPPHPNHHLRRMSITSRVRDGYTLVVGNPTDADGNTAEQPGDGQKRLLVFVTPTIVDPAGHRVNPPDALPFKSDSIPPQR